MAADRRAKVLVIDDDVAMRDMVACMLETCGLEVQPVADADEALFALQAHPYDLVVSDIYMPRRDGFEVARAARRIRPSTSIVLMSSFGSEATRSESEAAGADAFVSKPFSIAQLREAVRAALAKHAKASAPS